MAWVQQLIVTGLLLSILSCQGQKASDRDPLSASYQKIDQGDYDGAIAQLEELRTKDSRPAVKSALASAYAARAGLKVEKLWNFVKALNAPQITEEMVQKSTNFIQAQETITKNAILLGASSENDLHQMAKSMAAFEEYRSKTESLPYIAADKRIDLARGAEVLRGAETKGAHLYRAVLNLVFLRSELQDGFQYWDEVTERLKKLNPLDQKNPMNKQILCSIEITKFQGWLVTQFELVSEISLDIRIAFPSKAQEMIKFANSVQKYQQEIPRFQRTLYPKGC